MEVDMRLVKQMADQLAKVTAVYALLIQHAAGITDLTEDQLANVVEGVYRDALPVLREARREGWTATPATLGPPSLSARMVPPPVSALYH